MDLRFWQKEILINQVFGDLTSLSETLSQPVMAQKCGKLRLDDWA